MATDRRPGWWGLYALVPLMAGLLVLEHRASLAPAGHKFAQIGMVVCMYGLVWLWLRVNKLARLWVAYNTYGRTSVDEKDWAAQPLRSHLTPRRVYCRKVMARYTKRHATAQAYTLEIHKCSLN